DALTFQFRCLCSLGCRATQSSSSASDLQLAISEVYSRLARKRVRCRSVPALAALHANIGTTRSIFERCAAFVRERAHYSILNRWYGFIVGSVMQIIGCKLVPHGLGRRSARPFACGLIAS